MIRCQQLYNDHSALVTVAAFSDLSNTLYKHFVKVTDFFFFEDVFIIVYGVQLISYLEGGPLMWIMPMHLHVNQKSDYDMIYVWVNITEYSFEKDDFTLSHREIYVSIKTHTIDIL